MEVEMEMEMEMKVLDLVKVERIIDTVYRGLKESSLIQSTDIMCVFSHMLMLQRNINSLSFI